MSTTQTTPAAEPKVLEVSRNVFDLDSKEYVNVVKVGTFAPVADMGEFVARLQNDSAKILEIVNDGLEEYERKQLASSGAPWQVRDDSGALQPFTGTQINEEKAKQLGATVLNMAKMLFGYDEAAKIQDATARVAAKQDAKNKALAMILSNPAAVEGLKG
jgi:undecaprenyl pyrophosphate synthase